MLPTGLPTEIVSKSSNDELRFMTIMHAWGVSHGWRLAATLIDYNRTHSLFDLFNLVKLTGNFGQAYCISLLAVLLGRSAAQEASDLEFLFSPNHLREAQADGLPSVAQARPFFVRGQHQQLAAACEWFGYQQQLPAANLVLENPRLALDWLTQHTNYAYELRGLWPMRHDGCMAFAYSLLQQGVGMTAASKELRLVMLKLFSATEPQA